MRNNVKAFWKTRWKFICMYLAVIFLFVVVLFLYNVRKDAVDYAVFLSCFVGLVVFVLDFVFYLRHIEMLRHALSPLPYEMNFLPEFSEGAEFLYAAKVADLFQYKEELETKTSIGRQEMLDFYGLWVHQIKTPIAAMHLLLQSYDESGEGHADQYFLRSMQMELFKTEQYVDMVLSYLRMEEISSDMVFQWYPLDEIVRQTIRKYSQLFILKKIQLKFEPCEEMVLTDKKWIAFVLEQILSNALKYTHKGSISIYKKEGQGTVLAIEDTGIGIAQEDVPRIFEKGFTGYNGRSNSKSTGIGLYLCKSICDKLNHKITVESMPGEGSRFFLELHRAGGNKAGKAGG